MNRFEAKLTEAGRTLRRTFLETLQLNVAANATRLAAIVTSMPPPGAPR